MESLRLAAIIIFSGLLGLIGLYMAIRVGFLAYYNSKRQYDLQRLRSEQNGEK
jgi:hypothetical protein